MRYIIASLLLTFAGVAQAEPVTVSYGSDSLQKMIVSPLESAEHAPIMIMVHGGAWLGGDMTDTTVTEPKRTWYGMPEHGGFMFVSVNYRLTPKADALEQTKDVAKAVKYVQAHAAEWHGDPDNMILMGHSAGAHIVALLGANPEKFGLKPWRGTVVLDSAALDVKAIMTRQHFDYFNPAFGTDPKHWEESSPLDQLQANATPFFMVCTPQGPFLCSESQAFADKAESLGIPTVVRSENYEHIQLNDEVGKPGPYTAAIDRFIKHVMAPDHCERQASAY